MKFIKLIDYLILVLILTIFLTIVILFQFYYNNLNNECLKEPLVYGAKKLSQQYGYNFTGYGFFNVPSNIRSPQITFNKYNITID